MKTCSRCGISKPLADYPKAVTCLDGTRSYCKVCQKAYKDSHRKTYAKASNAARKRWADANTDKVATSRKVSNKKRATEGKNALAKAAWRAANIQKARAAVNARRRKLRMAMPPWVDRELVRAIYAHAAEKGLTIDHAVPINHPLVCGLHVPWNLVEMTSTHNYAKGNKFEVSP